MEGQLGPQNHPILPRDITASATVEKRVKKYKLRACIAWFNVMYWTTGSRMCPTEYTTGVVVVVMVPKS